MKLRWIGQSGYVINTETTEVIIDPYLSDAVNRVANRPRLFPAPIDPSQIKANAIICTHNHLDHLDTDAIDGMSRDLHFLTTHEGTDVLYKMGFDNVTALTIGTTVTIGDIHITAVYANHTVEAFGLILCADDQTLYFSGDTLYDEKLFSIADFTPDIACICINGRLGNMNADEAIAVAKIIGAKVNVPNHYDMFASNSEDPTRFTAALDNGLILEFDREYDVQAILDFPHK